MRHQKRVAKLGRTASHRKALMMNLAKSLIKHGKIKTTDAKAKELRRIVERLITYGKRGTVHHRRLAYSILQDRSVVKILFDHIAPQYTDRNGGYTRIVKLGFRDSDGASVSLIEFVDYRLPGEKKAPKPTKKESAPKKGKTPAAKPAGKEPEQKVIEEKAEPEKAVDQPVKEETVPVEVVDSEVAEETAEPQAEEKSDKPAAAAEEEKEETPA